MELSSEPLQASGRTLGQSSPSGRRQSLHVRWQAIDGACAEVLSFEAHPDVGVTISFSSSQAPSEEREEGSCGRCCCLCKGLFSSAPQPGPAGRASVLEVESFAMGRPLKDGLLWKLNSDIETGDEAKLADWTSWRCRQFFMSRSVGKLGLLYISEKQNGFMQLGALLNDSRDRAHPELAIVRELPVVSLEPLSAEETLQLGKTLHDYDLAFAEQELYSTDEQYVREIPDKLWPILIAWKDKHKKDFTLCLGAKNSKERVIWMKSMKIAMGLSG